jgi:enamine deaminase RidA (YjgF/YER057c/UK114 family)
VCSKLIQERKEPRRRSITAWPSVGESHRVLPGAEGRHLAGAAVGDRVLVSGTAPIWPDGACDPDPEVQARRCFEIIVGALREAGAGPEQVVRTRRFLTSADDGEAIARAHAATFGDVRAVSTVVVVDGFLDPLWKAEAEAEAILD